MGSISVALAFVLYFAVVLAMGIYFLKRSSNLSDYFLGGRNLNPWVTALSAQASDMSSWLLMGLPAAAYISGVSSSWLAIGLAFGTYINWKIIAKRLRSFTEVSGDSITIPEYFQNRFASKSVAIRAISAVIIFIFFLIYTASAFSAGAMLFGYVFHMDYRLAVTIGAFIIVAYTLMGGFMAVAWTDFFQGMLMFFALVITPLAAIFSMSDPGAALQGVSALDLFRFQSGSGVMSAISDFAWCLGYLGMPHILVRFMAIRSGSMIKKSRIIAMTWVLVSLAAATLVGIIGVNYLGQFGIVYPTSKEAEYVFIDMVAKVAPGFIAGILLSAILASGMSTADSQLLVTASAVSNDFYQPVINKKASEKQLVLVSRLSVLAIAVLAYVIALNPDNTIMGLVSYAWAGFGSAFGPVILFSLFWKRMTLRGAVAGMVAGGATVLLWESLSLQAATNVYSIIPGFALASLLIVICSLADKKPSAEVERIFDEATAKALEK